MDDNIPFIEKTGSLLGMAKAAIIDWLVAKSELEKIKSGSPSLADVLKEQEYRAKLLRRADELAGIARYQKPCSHAIWLGRCQDWDLWWDTCNSEGLSSRIGLIMGVYSNDEPYHTWAVENGGLANSLPLFPWHWAGFGLAVQKGFVTTEVETDRESIVTDVRFIEPAAVKPRKPKVVWFR